jgi:hypothetical protein
MHAVAFALERIERSDDERILYHLPKPTPEGCTRLTLTPLEFIRRLVAWRPMRGCGGL